MRLPRPSLPALPRSRRPPPPPNGSNTIRVELRDGQPYSHVFEDTPDADCQDNPHAYRIRCGLVTASDTIEANLARSGGQAVILEPAMEGDEERYEALE